MKLHEIENLSFDNLKARREELIKMAEADTSDLAARYVQARTDAAGRDVKLAEQGVTITSLNEALAASKGQLNKTGAELTKVKKAIEVSSGQLAQMKIDSQTTVSNLNSELQTIADELVAEQARSARLDAAANKYAGVVSSIQKLTLDAINAGEIARAGV